MRKRRAQRRAVGTRAPILVEAKPNARWSLDFVHDQFACGRRVDVDRLQTPGDCRFCRAGHGLSAHLEAV